MIPETLSVVERQILANQFRILSKIGNDAQNYETKIEILENGYTEQYYEVFDLNTEEIPLEICEETTQILLMYRRIEDTIQTLTDKEKKEFDLEKIKFEGFDSKKDPHYHYMLFMIDNMNMWPEYKGLYVNSHCEYQLSKYRRMLEYQTFLLDNDQYDLNKENLEHLIDVVVNPRNKRAIQLVR
ncbi:YfbU family protein [Flavobacterium sp.]|uniref:YfbU family protein n=1 Tax=Flavobacterium sp. TaxID=239 RepID=UPI003D6AD828